MRDLIRRPVMMLEAVRVYFAMRRHGRLTPSAAYLEWRAYTAYGDHKAGFRSDDLFHYLTWRRHFRLSAGRRRMG